MLGVFFFVLSAFAVQANAAATREIGTKKALIEFQQGIQNKTISEDTNVNLTADIDLGGTEWTPIHISGDLDKSTPTGYTGTFNGNGHVISGFNPGSVGKADGSYSYTGFAAWLGTGGVIKNLVLSGNIANNKPAEYLYVGTFAAENKGTIENCTSLCSINLPGTEANTKYKYAGGIAGLNFGGDIKSCTNNGRISAAQPSGENPEGHIGGITGSSWCGRIVMCVNTEDLLGYYSIGGITASANDTTVVSCVNTGSIKRQSEDCVLYYSGGIAGVCGFKSQITNCLNSGSVTAIYAGGIAGSCEPGGTGLEKRARISHCTNRGAVHGYYFEKDGAGTSLGGGITAMAYNTVVASCTNTGTVTAEYSVPGSKTMGTGGVVAAIEISADVSNCAFTGNAAYNYKIEASSYDKDSVKSFDVKILDKSAVTTLSLMPSVRLQPQGKSAFTLLVNGRAVTSQDIDINKITAVKSGDTTGLGFASIGDFADGIAPVEAKDKFGVGSQGYEFTFRPTDFKTLTAESSAALTGDANKFEISTPLFANVSSQSDTPSYGASSGGGCSAGFAALALLAMIPLTLRKKK